MIFKRKNKEPMFFEEEPVKTRFDILANFVAELDSKADYNKAIGAMECIFNAFQKLKGIKSDDDVVKESEFILHPEEDK